MAKTYTQPYPTRSVSMGRSIQTAAVGWLQLPSRTGSSFGELPLLRAEITFFVAKHSRQRLRQFPGSCFLDP